MSLKNLQLFVFLIEYVSFYSILHIFGSSFSFFLFLLFYCSFSFESKQLSFFHFLFILIDIFLNNLFVLFLQILLEILQFLFLLLLLFSLFLCCSLDLFLHDKYNTKVCWWKCSSLFFSISWMYFFIYICSSRSFKVSEKSNLLFNPLTFSVSWKSFALAFANSSSFNFCWNLRSSSSTLLRSSSSFSNFLNLSSSFLCLRYFGLSPHWSVRFWLSWNWYAWRLS